MADGENFAQLGIDFQTHGVDEAAHGMDNVASSADKAKKATDGLSDSAERLNTATGNANAGLIKMAATVGAVAGAVGSLAVQAFRALTDHLGEFIKSVIEAGAQSEHASVVLQVVGANAGWTATQIELVKDAFAKSNIVGDEAEKAMTRLAAAHLSAASSAKVGALAADLSVASNRSLAETTMLVAQAIATGNQRAFFQLGINVNMNKALKDEAKTLGDHVKTLTLAQAAEARWAAIQQASIGYTGAHAAALNTLVGKAETLTAKWTLLKEAIGTAVLPLAKAAIDDIANAMSKVTPLIEKFVEGFKDATAPGTDLQKIFAALSPIIDMVWTALESVGSAMLDIVQSPLAKWVADTLTDAFVTLLSAVGELKPALMDIQSLFKDIYSDNGLVKYIGSELVHAFKDLVEGIQTSIYQMKAFAAVVSGVMQMGAAFLDPKLSGNQTVQRIMQIAKDTDAKQAQIEQQYAMRNVDWSKTAAPQRGTTVPTSFRPGATQAGAVDVPGSDRSQKAPKDENQQAIDKAIIDELKARQAINGDLMIEAQLKHKEIAVELDSQIQQLQQKVTAGNITKATAARATLIYQQAAKEKDILADREVEDELQKRILEHQKTVSDYENRRDKASTSIAVSAETRAKLEDAILTRTQQQEINDKNEADDKAVRDGKLSAADAKIEEAKLRTALATERQAKELESSLNVIHESAQRDQDYQQLQTDLLKSEQDAAQTETERYEIGKKILASEQATERSKAEEAIKAAEAVVLADKRANIDPSGDQQALDLAYAKYANLIQIQANETKAQTGNFLDNVSNATSGFQSLAGAIKSHNWVQVFQALDQIIVSVIKIMEAFGNSAGSSGGLGSLFGGGQSGGSGIFGKIGNFVKGIFGGGGAALGGFGGIGGALGSAIGGGAEGLTLGGVANFGGIGGSLGSAIGGATSALGGFAGAISAAIPYVGVIAGIASLFGGLFKSKPSNFTAISQFHGLDSVSFTGDKPNENTMNLIKQASGGILEAEKSLSQFGVTVKTTIAAIEIGQRDASQIHLSTGKILTSAAGDAAAAADTALKAVLAEAEYADPQMKKLVDSMLAAGKGFDDITSALQNYKDVQDSISQVANSILQFTDPLKAGINGVTDAIQKQRDAYAEDLKQMYITQEQFDSLNGQLSQLAQLQIGQVFAQLKDQLLSGAKTALQDSYNALIDKTNAAQTAVNDAQNALLATYNNEVSIRQNVISTFKQFSQSLKDFLKTLDTSVPGLSPENAYNAIKAQYQEVTAKTMTGTREERAAASEQYQQIAQAFLQASQSYNGVGQGFQNDLAAVKKNTQDAIARDDLTVTNAQRQIEILTQNVGANIKINDSVLTVEQGIRNLLTAKQALAIATQQQKDAEALVNPILDINHTLLDIKDALNKYYAAQSDYNNKLGDALKTASGGGADYSKYVEGNQDLLAFWQKQQDWAKGLTEIEFGLQHWMKYGQYENRAIKPYATGGEFQVGGAGGTDSQKVTLMASPDEHILVRTPQQIANDNQAQMKTAEGIEDVAIAIEKMSEKLDSLIYEARADKTQRSEGVRITAEGLKEIRDSFETFRRRQAS